MCRDYLAFFISLFLSRLADQILLFIVPLVVFQTTQSASWAGLAFFAESLPRYLAFPPCGALCDRFSPVRILHISQACRALLCVVATLLYAIFGGLAWLVVLSALCGILTTQGIMAREVLMPHIFQHYSYTKTLSYSQIADQTGLVLGPLVAALWLNIWAWYWVVMWVAGLFVLADLSMRVWQRLSNITLEVHAQHQDIWLQPLRIAFGHIHALAELKKIITLAVGVNLIVGVTLATSAAMVIGEYRADTNDYAGLQTAGAVATIVILLLLTRLPAPLRILGGVAYPMIAAGAFITAMSPNLAGYTTGFLLIVSFDKMFNVYMRSIRQRVIPPQDFGKTVGVITLLNNLSQPLAGLLVALLAAPLGVQGVILGMAAVTALLGVFAVWWFVGVGSRYGAAKVEKQKMGN
ncbi:Major facilitator transporter [Pseudomonas cannabina pv. alisalensis]|uniref:Major facilitator transporter n=2 Tax=Pseudomonas cannabina TaxID=86840 RepID=A0A3M3Q5T2_PSECA|nr:MFS transporter [Pseudomonas cannabina]KPW20075.1 Major facilitator transporter [Pseudomonas cannabina pv. alisalensis]MBM0141804.1 MFS transporter [Pseudomonas cannabina pv. alisalensis]RMN76828.1 Major facilitator transporter [Pseudomonas cannabina pv. alisalensis]RMN79591.1 Major facilitator transporter [Pseudomonas cannabina]RMN87681.1 Major facilitator transporter [Pseudomonas cannabina]